MTRCALQEYADASTARIGELEAKINEEVGGTLQSMFAELFLDFPQIKTVAFVCYTPSQGDGDPVHYGITEPVFHPVDAELITGPEAEAYGGGSGDDEDYDDDDGDDDVEVISEEVGGAINPAPFEVEDYEWRRDDRVSPEMRAAMQALTSYLNQVEHHLSAIFEDGTFVRITKDETLLEDTDYGHR